MLYRIEAPASCRHVGWKPTLLAFPSKAGDDGGFD
jgi:hypothetical protein